MPMPPRFSLREVGRLSSNLFCVRSQFTSYPYLESMLLVVALTLEKFFLWVVVHKSGSWSFIWSVEKIVLRLDDLGSVCNLRLCKKALLVKLDALWHWVIMSKL